MVKIKRDKRFVWPDRYYIWTYMPKKYRKSTDQVHKDRLYYKHVCCIPYFTRRHAKHVVAFFHGVKALKAIHIISGKRLIQQGFSTFNMRQRVGRKRIARAIFYRDQVRFLRQWAYPPEDRYDKHRRRHYIVKLNKAFKNGGRNGFNRKYNEVNYGSSYRRFKRAYLRGLYKKAVFSILQEIQETNSGGEG